MKLFLLWRAAPSGSPDLAPTAVAERLTAQFAPLLAPELTTQIRSVGNAHLVWLELPVEGFRAPFFEQTGRRWALAPEYPLNARRLLRARGLHPREGAVLTTLSQELEACPEGYVRELIPPAVLLWGNPEAGEIRVQNDGLGQAQLFEYEQDGLWVLTNRVMAVRALGVALRPVAEEWAARFVTNWFPLDRSGYEGVRTLPGGTQIVVGRHGVRRKRMDPVGSWIAPDPLPRSEALELGRHGLKNALLDASELCESPTLGLSGGWDSRAVAACLRSLGVAFKARVRGQPNHFDVIVSAELARIAGIPHRIKSEGGIPPDSAEGCRASILQALLWQGGYHATKKHKNFLAKKTRTVLDGGVVNVMGQHAGVGKADFVKMTDALAHPEASYEDRLVATLRASGPRFLRREQEEAVDAQLRASYRAADRHGLRGLGPLLYFYVNEFTRRWGSATLASQTGVVVAPFLAPDVIRACFLLPPEELPSKPLHRHVTALEAPDWAGVPYADQLSEEDVAQGRIPLPARAPEAAPAEDAGGPRWKTVRHHRKYHYKFYWKDVGLPLLEEAFAQGGFWTRIFDPDEVRKGWIDCVRVCDAVAVAHLLPEVLGPLGSSDAPSRPAALTPVERPKSPREIAVQGPGA